MRAFQNAVQYALASKFFRKTESKASSRRSINGVHSTERCRLLSYRQVAVNRLIFKIACMLDNAVVVVVCPIPSLIECRIQELVNQGIATCSVGVDGLLKDGILKHSVAWYLPAQSLIVREERWRKLLQSKGV